MTTDLYFRLDLLDARPELRLLADLLHYLVGRECSRKFPARPPPSTTPTVRALECPCLLSGTFAFI
jgi:hypothetical protein